MKIEVIAAAPYDGWAFIVKEEKIFLLRPPYISSNLSEVSEDVVAKAVSAYGFVGCDAVFDNINEVIRFLKDQLVKSRKDLGFEVPSSEELKELLKYFDDDVLFKYLRRAQVDLIPERNFEAAESIALEIMKLERVETNPEMRRMAIEILERCKQERKKLEALEGEIANNAEETWKDRFPRAVKKYTARLIVEYHKSIQKRGQLLPIGRAGA